MEPAILLPTAHLWSSRLRIWVGALLFVIALALCFWGYSMAQSSPVASGVMLNLGTELIGIVLTVVFVEWLFEERKKRDDAKRLALQFLHEIDYAVWVWQGGRRQFSSTELQDLLLKAGLDDQIAMCTARLLMNLGEKAAQSLKYEEAAVRCSPRLSRGLRDLEPFVQMRDPGYTLSTAEVRDRLRNAAYVLAKATEVRRFDSVFPLNPVSRDPSVDQQERRFAGGYLELRLRPRAPSLEG